MEENNTLNTTSEEKTSKPVKEKKDNKKSDNKKSAKNLLGAYKAEFKKIAWPSKDELIKETITVICVSLLVGAIIFCYDSAFGFVLDAALKLFSK